MIREAVLTRRQAQGDMSDLPNQALIEELRDQLRLRSNPAKAPGMQRYMKSAMPYLGVTSPELSTVCRAVFPHHTLDSADSFRATVLELWRTASYREERYAAIAITGDKRYANYQTPELVPVYEELIITGAWWDYVDSVATHRVGPLLASYREPMSSLLRHWSRDPDMWKRRTAIIAQVSLKHDLDFDLLSFAIEPNLDDREFFIRKAIGWALREDAKRYPERVERFVSEHAFRLSGLSRREAVKGIGYGHLRNTAKRQQ